ncbi:YqaJ viral recombinase family protein [Pseudomonas sp. EMN2]|uniref:YqaJ viral recombinase family protein n=1 Tax=Pseudomonas sp. EMN2 TaxID=2615212 RepID=UPI00129B9012|nr:YqaJ viral recombinase family protein [Pseudomonas sp. EMN2]
MQSFVESLPQFSVIEPDDALRWAYGVDRYHGKRAAWHAKRLAGIGGSEMGAIVSHYRGRRHQGFQSIAHVVEGKLMKRIPAFETFHMRRGNELESLALQAYLIKTGATLDHAAMAAIQAAKKQPGYEFMAGNPDLIAIVDGRRILVDLKVPSAFSEEIEFDYEIQLHHYATLANLAGIRIHGLELAKLDLPSDMSEHLTKNIHKMESSRIAELARSLVTMDMPGCRIVPLQVEFKRSLQAELLAAGKRCWNEFVLQGVVPNPGPAEKLELDASTEADLKRYQQQYLMAKSGVKHLTHAAKEAQEAIDVLLAGKAFQDKELPISAVTVKTPALDHSKVVAEALERGANAKEIGLDTPGYNIGALLDEIQRLGGKIDLPHLFEESFDPKKAENFLRASNVDLDAFRKPGLAVELSRKGADKNTLEIYERLAAARFGAWISEEQMADDEAKLADQPDAAFEPFLPIEMETGHLSAAFADPASAAHGTENQPIPMRASPGLN